MDGSRVYYTNLGVGELENERVRETGMVVEWTFQCNSCEKNATQAALYLCIYLQTNVLMENHKSRPLSIQTNRNAKLVTTQKVGRYCV